MSQGVRIDRFGARSFRLSTRLHLPGDRERVFDFFARAGNLGLITPPELGFRMLTPEPAALSAGSTIDYTIRLWHMPMRWRTLISRWEPPFVFVDEQLVGPYAQWVHTHRFVPDFEGTTVEDEVIFTLPLGRLGQLGAPLVRRQLKRIFTYRQQRVSSLMRD